MDDKSAKADVGKTLLNTEVQLAGRLMDIKYPENVKYVYNPLEYAINPHTKFVKKYASTGPKPILFLGMNPGPWGMAQTGVPFGEVQHVQEWLQIIGEVQKPDREHPKKLIKGFSSQRREVSGERFWSFVKSNCHHPNEFLDNCLVYNHCPLLFMDEKGKNLTPPDLELETRNLILKFCDDALKSVIELYQVQHVVGIGRFAEMRTKKVLEANNIPNVKVHFMVHPSPASAVANRGWSELAMKSLKEAQIYDIVFRAEKNE